MAQVRLGPLNAEIDAQPPEGQRAVFTGHPLSSAAINNAQKARSQKILAHMRAFGKSPCQAMIPYFWQNWKKLVVIIVIIFRNGLD